MLMKALNNRKVNVQSRLYLARIDLAAATPGTAHFKRARETLTREQALLLEVKKAQLSLSSQGLLKSIPNVVRALLH